MHQGIPFIYDLANILSNFIVTQVNVWQFQFLNLGATFNYFLKDGVEDRFTLIARKVVYVDLS